MNRYLLVTIGDNDFGMALQGSLKRLYQIVVENNFRASDNYIKSDAGYTFFFNPRMISDVFHKIYACNDLNEIIVQMLLAENRVWSIEFQTRGVMNYFGAMDESYPFFTDFKKGEELIEDIRRDYKYFSNGLRVEFRDTDANNFGIDFGNGEYCVLDLWSGAVWSF